ncbi:MAG: Hsp20 family protein [Hyphomonadaceae bacterium]|jgi:molecular chaperone IbpA|nr:Hsp20 family protein [Hyphomonadaceae bacterium]
MRSVDLTPLYRSIVGFDRMAHQIELAARQDAATGWPPYNIEHVAEDTYRIELAVAGFGPGDLDIELKDGVLTVVGKKAPADGDKRYLHRGIAERGFERRFQLADHVHVTGADLVNGLLVIDLVREVPEALKPRKIAIGGAANTGTLIEAETAKADDPKADDQAA